MALSVAQVCNLALSHVGITEGISDIDDVTDVNAVACKTLYEPLRDALTVQYDWPYARRWSTLGLVSTNPTSEWRYSYQAPLDYLVLRKLVSGERYDLTADASGFKIYTNDSAAVLRYTAKVDNPGLLPHQIAMALAWSMAEHLAPAKAKTEGATERCKQEALRALAIAVRTCLNEARPYGRRDAESITARG